MKRANHLIEKILDIDNLRLAYYKARKGKAHSQEVRTYVADLDRNLLQLQTQIATGNVQVGNYHYFKIYDPKERQICASAFSEQVLHHALMNICHPYFERVQIFDSYASRKGKGTYAALQRAKYYTNKYHYFLKLDVKKFFDSIEHTVLKRQLDKMFKDRTLLGIFDKIINSYEASPNRGMPIGNLTSQYFANHYLAHLDHFIKEDLQILGYTRYMDDMILWDDDKHFLKTAHKKIQLFIENELKSCLKPELLDYSRRGLPFLGYILFPYYVRLAHRSRFRFIQKMILLQINYDLGVWTLSICQRHILPMLAFLQHAQTIGFRKAFFQIKSVFLPQKM